MGLKDRARFYKALLSRMTLSQWRDGFGFGKVSWVNVVFVRSCQALRTLHKTCIAYMTFLTLYAAQNKLSGRAHRLANNFRRANFLRFVFRRP